MGINEREIDITKNIKIIESLKCELLSDISQLYTSMSEYSTSESAERDDILANMIMITYMLSKRLGISYQALDMKILNKLKLGIIENDNEWYLELVALSKHIEKSRRLD
jgi:hypothetical protein